MVEQSIADVVRGLVAPIVKVAVAEALAEHARDSGPEALWDRPDTATYLKCSLVKLDGLVARIEDPIPSIKIDGSRRFVPSKVRQWATEQQGAA
jgi:hypothetical protein